MTAEVVPAPEGPEHRSLLYRETAVEVVDALSGVARAVFENAVAQRNVHAPYKNWFLHGSPNIGEKPSYTVGRETGKTTELLFDDPNGVQPYRVGYSSFSKADPGTQIISELQVLHNGTIESRSYVYPPVGDPNYEPPFEPIPDDPDSLLTVKQSALHAAE